MTNLMHLSAPSLADVPLDTVGLVALAAALGWGSGLRLYAVVFLTGLAGRMGWVPLPEGLHVLTHPLLLGGAGLMLAVEFLADKVPWVDSLWDAIHTFIRIPAGAALAAGVASSYAGGDSHAWTLVAALLGGTLSATAHTAKAATRAAANTSPEPFSNLGLSLAGDVSVPAMLWLAWAHPLVFLVVLAVVLLVMVVLIVVLMRFLRGLVRRLAQRFGASHTQRTTPP
jgi:Domain of unknown function (DUF4126)